MYVFLESTHWSRQVYYVFIQYNCRNWGRVKSQNPGNQFLVKIHLCTFYRSITWVIANTMIFIDWFPSHEGEPKDIALNSPRVLTSIGVAIMYEMSLNKEQEYIKNSFLWRIWILHLDSLYIVELISTSTFRKYYIIYISINQHGTSS